MTESPSTVGTPVIEMNDVAVGSAPDLDRVILEKVNWTVNGGDYWVVAGLHGSGKSDFVSMTAGLTPPQQGSYRLFGREMPMNDEENLAERLRLGTVFDSGQLLHHLSIHENIALPLHYHRKLSVTEVENRVKAMLELVEITPFADAVPRKLSRNWQKRAGLARALILEPEVLLVDNPLGGLDPRHAAWWLGFLDQISTGRSFMAGRRTTLVITADDLRPWRNHNCHLALLDGRRFVALDQNQKLTASREPLVKELLAEHTSPRSDDKL